WPDIYDWYSQLFFGFQIGNTQVSFAVLLASIIVFGLAYGAARLFQSWLDARILKPAGISGGVRDSIRIGVGYIGIVIAALAALSLCRLQSFQSCHPGWGVLRRYRSWPAGRGQQFRVWPDPFGGAARKGW